MMKFLSHTKIPKLLVESAKRYFQIEIDGLENIPKYPEPSILVMNHTAFFGLEVYLLNIHIMTMDPEIRLKTLVWEGFMNGPLGLYFKTLGCEAANISTGVDLLKKNRTVIILPEGVGATDVRNRFNKFHTGFLRIVKEYPVPIIPIGFYGCDQSIPWFVSHNKTLVKTFMKPVDPNFDFCLIPKLPIFRPTKIVFKVGEPILYKKEDLSSEKKIKEQTKAIQTKIEHLVDDAQRYRNERINESMLNKIYHTIVQGHITNF